MYLFFSKKTKQTIEEVKKNPLSNQLQENLELTIQYINTSLEMLEHKKKSCYQMLRKTESILAKSSDIKTPRQKNKKTIPTATISTKKKQKETHAIKALATLGEDTAEITKMPKDSEEAYFLPNKKENITNHSPSQQTKLQKIWSQIKNNLEKVEINLIKKSKNLSTHLDKMQTNDTSTSTMNESSQGNILPKLSFTEELKKHKEKLNETRSTPKKQNITSKYDVDKVTISFVENSLMEKNLLSRANIAQNLLKKGKNKTEIAENLGISTAELNLILSLKTHVSK